MVFLAQLFELCVAVMTRRYDHVCLCDCNLVELEFSVQEFLILESGLVSASASAAAEIIRLVRPSIHEILLAGACLDGKAKVVGRTVAKPFSYQIARILDGEFETFRIPGRIDLQLTFADPLCIEGDNA
jgi:hypothetical protein